MHTPSTTTSPESGRQLLLHHFDDLEQQHLSSNLGMWFFLVSEVMFFSGLIAAYTVYRAWSPEAFHLASRHMDKWLGFFNTWVLLTSSLTMALAVRCSQVGDRRGIVRNLFLTLVFGTAFLGVKATCSPGSTSSSPVRPRIRTPMRPRGRTKGARGTRGPRPTPATTRGSARPARSTASSTRRSSAATRAISSSCSCSTSS